MKIQKVIILGDVHGDWRNLNAFINNEVRGNKEIKDSIKNGDEIEVIILQVGDFGWWPHMDQNYSFDSPRK
jgi:hypothetical protein